MQDLTNSKYNFLKAEQILRSDKGRQTPNLSILENLIYPKSEIEQIDDK